MWLEPEPKFVPHPLLRGPHWQTVGAAYLWRRRALQTQTRHVLLPDGDRLAIHDDRPPAWRPGQRVVLLVHGLAGCHQSGYMQRIAAKLVAAGYRAFRLDLRGCGAGMLLARYSVHAGRTGDLQAAAEHIERWCPESPLTAVGFSLGASILLKRLGEDSSSLPPQLDSAIAVAPPLDLAACCRQIRLGWNQLYDRKFVSALKGYLQRRRRHVPDLAGADIELSRALRTLYDFDAHFTAPVGGFRTVDEYYEQASSHAGLPQISVPTRILFAADDPLVPQALFQQAEFSGSTEVFATQAGGHLGFLADHDASRSPDADWHWMDWRVLDWVRHFDQHRWQAAIPAAARV